MAEPGLTQVCPPLALALVTESPRGAAHRTLLSPAHPAARTAHLTDQTVVGVEVSVDDVHRMEVGLRTGVRLSVMFG